MRGEIFLVNLEPAVGSEANKTRPAVVVSNDSAYDIALRDARGVVTVVPLTSNTARVYSFQTVVPAKRRTGLRVESKAQAEQIRAVDIRRLERRVGVLDAETLAALDRAIRVHLSVS
jgi:mRNA interferase MazF